MIPNDSHCPHGRLRAHMSICSSRTLHMLSKPRNIREMHCQNVPHLNLPFSERTLQTPTGAMRRLLPTRSLSLFLIFVPTLSLLVPFFLPSLASSFGPNPIAPLSPFFLVPLTLLLLHPQPLPHLALSPSTPLLSSRFSIHLPIQSSPLSRPPPSAPPPPPSPSLPSFPQAPHPNPFLISFLQAPHPPSLPSVPLPSTQGLSPTTPATSPPLLLPLKSRASPSPKAPLSLFPRDPQSPGLQMDSTYHCFFSLTPAGYDTVAKKSTSRPECVPEDEDVGSATRVKRCHFATAKFTSRGVTSPPVAGSAAGRLRHSGNSLSTSPNLVAQVTPTQHSVSASHGTAGRRVPRLGPEQPSRTSLMEGERGENTGINSRTKALTERTRKRRSKTEIEDKVKARQKRLRKKGTEKRRERTRKSERDRGNWHLHSSLKYRPT
ncbi:hypothetical protein C7M84_015276 [Penaeus vannamei]|uniref:Uncharacterized protein n=1 Tax=Penaeus vannamei TaxID=6689 RepID=A0A423SR69_PENVA|nr:hypothetical protein C7M84_015276 [Penaeus vannamei]